MPRRSNQIPDGEKQTLLNMSFENQVITWLMQDGWQVFVPTLDHGHKTDILISDGQQYFRIQIKTVCGTKGKKQVVQNAWKNKKIDYVIYFARNGEWGFITPAFSEDKKILNSPEHKQFGMKKKEFLTAFHTID